MVSRPEPQAAPLRTAEEGLALVAQALDRIRFGDIRLTIHEGRLVQVDITERTRLTQT
jgi:hypothetical protein